MILAASDTPACLASGTSGLFTKPCTQAAPISTLTVLPPPAGSSLVHVLRDWGHKLAG